MPRKTSLNWFIPALVKSSVGSFDGTSDDECTSLCPFCTKKSRNLLRISEPVGMGEEFLILASKKTRPQRTGEDGAVQYTDPPDLSTLCGGLAKLELAISLRLRFSLRLFSHRDRCPWHPS